MGIRTMRLERSNIMNPKVYTMSDKKEQTDLKPVITNKKDNQKAGYGGRAISPSNNESSEEE